MRENRFVKAVAVLIAASTAWAASGCFGRFQLTRSVYDLNQSVSDKYLRSAVTWVFVIAPVYGVAGLLDFVVFNLIEFWSGENPVAGGGTARTAVSADGGTVMTISRDGEATVAVIERRGAAPGASAGTLRVRDDGRGAVVSELVVGGKTVRRTTASLRPDGSAVVTSHLPRPLAETYPASAVETVLARVARGAGRAI